MRLKPTHLKAAAEVLEGDFPNAAEAAKAVIAEVDRLRSQDVTYIIVRQIGGVILGTGPFPTTNAAVTAIQKGLAGPAGTGNVAVVPVRTVEARSSQLTLVDAQDDERPANHWTRILERVQP